LIKPRVCPSTLAAWALGLLVASLGGGPLVAAEGETETVLPAPADEVPGGADGAAEPAPFAGIAWSLAAYRSGDGLVAVESTEGPSPASFRFEEGRLGGSVGCNRLLADFTRDGDALTFEPNAVSTMMACPEPLAAQERALAAAFAAAASFRMDGKLLEILDGAGQPLLRFIALEPSPLTGQIWRLEGLNNGRDAVVSVLADTEITLELRDDGTLGGSDGCNRYMSGFTLEGETLSFGPLATTRMACRGPEGAAEQAGTFANALASVTGFRVEGGELTLLTAQGATAARFRVQEPPAPAPAARSPAGSTSDPETPER
jgi:heat shock protein HslJ